MEADNHRDEQDDKADKREGFFQGDVGLEVIGHLEIVVVADHEPRYDTREGSDFPEEAPKDTLDKKKGDQSNDDNIKDIHVRSLGNPFHNEHLIPSRGVFYKSSCKIAPRFYPHLITNRGYAKRIVMSKQNRILLALGIILLDLIVFFLPLTAFFLAYVVLYNPPWVKDFLEGLDEESGQ